MTGDLWFVHTYRNSRYTTYNRVMVEIAGCWLIAAEWGKIRLVRPERYLKRMTNIAVVRSRHRDINGFLQAAKNYLGVKYPFRRRSEAQLVAGAALMSWQTKFYDQGTGFPLDPGECEVKDIYFSVCEHPEDWKPTLLIRRGTVIESTIPAIAKGTKARTIVWQ